MIPKTFRKQLLSWFAQNRRDLPWRRTNDPYFVWVSEVMLQQTRTGTVVPYFNRFIERFPDVHALASADIDDVLKSWEKLGYYARARNLHAAARRVSRELDGRMPVDYDGLRELPGVGDYIASAVASIAYDLPHAVVDGNVRRVIARLLSLEVPTNAPASAKAFKGEAEGLLDRDVPGDFNQAMMELGATVCKPRQPLCGECPVSDHCAAFQEDRQHELPVRLPRRAVPKYHIAVGVIRKGDRVLITRRRDEGLLGGLWEFPGGKVRPGEDAASACRREIREETNLDVRVTGHLTRVEHAYTHFRVGLDVYACAWTAGSPKLQGPVDYRWVVADDLDRFAFPGANHKFLPLVKETLKTR